MVKPLNKQNVLPLPVTFCHKLVSFVIQISQRAFKGVTDLNPIQSIAFEAAYNSDENLLICAPTGAGKTNIAMLTILREIKKHTHKGVIQKDKFKVRL